MLSSWTSTLRVSPHDVRLLITEPETGDLVKARLPIAPRHPRALLTMLEGLALWRGHPLGVVISATDSSRCGLESGLFGDELWPGESALVRFEVGVRARREARRLTGLGDFRALRLTAPRGELE